MTNKEALEVIRAAIGSKALDKRTKEYKAIQRIEKELHIVSTPIEKRIHAIFKEMGLE